MDNILSIDHSDTRVSSNEKRVNGVVVANDISIIGSNGYGIHKGISNGDTFKFGLSAKVLLDDYAQGIHINNIDQALNNYNKFSPVQLDVNRVIDDSLLLSLDSTQMIYPDYKSDVCADSLMSLRTNRKCKITNYKGNKNCGVEINSSVKSVRRRLIMYDKHLSLMFGVKSVRAFLENCKHPDKVLNDCIGAFRVEQSHTSFKTIKNRFKVLKNGLLQVLHSSENVNYNFLEKVQKEAQQMDIFFDAYSDYRLMDVEKMEGRKGICNHFNCDMDMIIAFIRTKVNRTSAYKYIETYREVVRLIKQDQKPLIASSQLINEHIIGLIKKSA